MLLYLHCSHGPLPHCPEPSPGTKGRGQASVDNHGAILRSIAGEVLGLQAISFEQGAADRPAQHEPETATAKQHAEDQAGVDGAVAALHLVLDAGPGGAKAAGEEAVRQREDDEHGDLVPAHAPQQEHGHGAAEARDQDHRRGGEARVVQHPDEQGPRHRGQRQQREEYGPGYGGEPQRVRVRG